MMPEDDNADYVFCDHCGKKIREGFILGRRHACDEECAIALYGGNAQDFIDDVNDDDDSCGYYGYVDSF